ncbi:MULTISPECIES: M20 metallopeptidase family protein [Megasphaera]|uniref:Amidohydrolase n=1 Tax=Megasphaera vaginalis (ex Srinivasan et al. 2021) TaxID=1111454 RepID=U7UJY3_9FIRM|nr:MULTISPECIES: M20 family metallopeptidase [Megasphaera]ERT59189.1 amidohydrolase [Megasphaera vaginalis (ex Srinivasan et al. 2021)]
MKDFVPDFTIRAAVRKVLPYMMEMREYFHAHPELSEREFDTCKMIFQELSLMGIEDVKIIAGTGVTGLIRGELPGPTLLLRADIDALPLAEKFDCPYASLADGIMHACGHDGHAANLLGTAKILQDHRDCLRGTVRLAFQPAEEGSGGAARMIDSGILNNPPVDYALGLHVAGGLPRGYVGLRSGEINSSCDDFIITLHGKGGHGSQPSLCVSPIQMGLSVIQDLQNFVYHCHADGDGVILTFGQFQSGQSPNVIPDTAELKGTLRTYDEKKRHLILDKMEEILHAVTRQYGGTFDLNLAPFSPVCINDAAATEKVGAILKEHCLDSVSVVPMKRGSGSEDFAYFAAAVPSVFYYVGIYKDEPVIGHSPQFHWDSSALKYMCETLVTIVYYFASYV